MKQERNSSIELLRILAIFGIVVMHTNAAVMKECYGINQIWTQIENGVFNTGVSIFVLIAGFYGIKRNKNKIITLWTTVAFYSVLSAMVGCILMGESVKNLIIAAIPISSNRYWFVSCYIILMLFSPYINRIIASISQSQFTRLLALMSVAFLVCPTLLYYSVLGGGKNIVNMLLLYFLGAYIHKYNLHNLVNEKVLLRIFFITTTLNILLNLMVSMATGGGQAHIPFARDCSMFIVVEAVAIMLLFVKITVHSEIINILASHVFAVYLFEGAFRNIIKIIVFDYTIYEHESYWFLINIIVALCLVVGCIFIDFAVQKLLEPLRNLLLRIICELQPKVTNYLLILGRLLKVII